MAIKTESIITRYQADTTSHEQGVDRINAKHETLKKGIDDYNKATDEAEKKSGEAWKKILGGVAAVTGAVLVAKESFAAYAKEQKLIAAAGTADIDRLSSAAGGLMTRMQLLEFAAKSQAGANKLNAEQMDMSMKAIRALTRAGFEQEEVTQKVTEAIVKLDGGALMDFGVRVKDATGDTEKFKAIMEALGGEAAKVDGAVTSESESIQALGVKFTDSFDRMKSSLGALVVEFEPLIRLIADALDLLADIPRSIRNFRKSLDTSSEVMSEELAKADTPEKLRAWEEKYMPEEERTGYVPNKRGMGAYVTGIATRAWDSQFGIGRFATGAFEAQAGRKPTSAADVAAAALERARAEALAILRSGTLAGGNLDVKPFSGGVEGFGTLAVDPSLGVDAGWSAGTGMDFDPSKYSGEADQAARAARTKSRLEEMFGPIEEINGYKIALDALGGAAGAAMGAWIDGSKSAGDAFKEFIGEAVKGLAIQMTIESVKHGAFALGNLAFGNLAGAAMHGKAAAAFAVGAGLAALAARELGGGGAGVAANAGGGYGAASSAAPTGGAGPNALPAERHSIAVIGNEFRRRTPRQQRLDAEELVADALGTTGAVYG